MSNYAINIAKITELNSIKKNKKKTHLLKLVPLASNMIAKVLALRGQKSKCDAKQTGIG